MSNEASETGAKMPPTPQGAPCWIEIPSVEPKKLKEFYAALFPAWNFRSAAEEDPVVHYTFAQPSGLSGGIIKLPEGCTRSEHPMGVGFTVYYFVESVDEIEKKISELGGKKVLDKTAERTHGWFANYVDPEGNRFGVFEVNQADSGAM
ncbi:hypothetical protein BU26DRAFT_516415 [Trematosphaeria pertusa]|uniref:VOC domain-containing protein n=1 Tax=Trematosphaeria pertusa TaxID=390896 RepID=A0A6A6IMH7_9PLEO|nr:uncharacterized protein BU26DRAFT_516415 [Trematosphaeria pertusa]KAF2251626.1 hypothetical protein BU26DRAFT_516415 [Trematosphaeria pertusa]